MLAAEEKRTKETPAPLGVGWRWELRSLGRSSNRSRRLGTRKRRKNQLAAVAQPIERKTDRAIRVGM